MPQAWFHSCHHLQRSAHCRSFVAQELGGFRCAVALAGLGRIIRCSHWRGEEKDSAWAQGASIQFCFHCYLCWISIGSGAATSQLNRLRCHIAQGAQLVIWLWAGSWESRMAEEFHEATGTTTGGSLSHLPWSMIPSFEPGVTSVDEFAKKLEFLSGLWPSEHLHLLAPRVAMQCKGSAFQRIMRLNPADLKVNTPKGVEAIVKALGGVWGKSKHESKFEKFEKALYTTSQKGDETHESYLARHDHHFEDLLSMGTSFNEVRAYCLVRNSGLTIEDKRRIILDSSGKLEYDSVVSSMKLIGSQFFQQVQTGTRPTQRTKTYDVNVVEDETPQPTLHSQAEENDHIFVGEHEDSIIDAGVEEGDPDALICMQFEEAIIDVLQSDADTAACLTSYVEARKRLTDRNKNRGFWQGSNSKGSYKGGKGKGKGKRARKPLAQRIMESECRRCGQVGHWKAECPLLRTAGTASSGTANKDTNAFAGVAVGLDDPEEPLTDDDMILITEVPVPLPQVSAPETGVRSNRSRDDSNKYQVAYMGISSGDTQSKTSSSRFQNLAQRLLPLIKNQMHKHESPQRAEQTDTKHVQTQVPVNDLTHPTNLAEVCFVNHGSRGIVDLGASQSVIGQQQIDSVLQELPSHIRKAVREIPCSTTFRFGNNSTVQCHRAVLVPLGKWYVKLCIVPSETPFLLSNNVFRTLGALIDTENDSIFFRKLKITMQLTLSQKKLYLLDFGRLVQDAWHTN